MTLSKAIKGIKRAETLYVTPVVEDWLRKVPDGVIWDDNGIETFRDLVQRASRNDHRSGRFGASSRGTCQRKQMFSYLGMPGLRLIDTDTQNLFNDGKWRHLRWQMMGLQSGFLTHAEYSAAMPKYHVKVSMDGLNADGQWLFELKGDRFMARAMDGVPDAHDLQIHTMLLVTGWEMAVYVIEDKASQQFREMIVHRDEATIQMVRRELEELNEHVEHRTLPAVLPSCHAKEGPYRTCEYAPECLKRHREGNAWPDIEGDWDS